jgi:hypothetical protein
MEYMVRWVSSLLILLLIAMPLALAHKSPIIEYGQSGMWRTEYSYYPRQPVVNDPITVTEKVSHLDGQIKGNVTTVFSIYQDDSVNDWYGGQQYKNSKWLLIKSGPGQPTGEENMFSISTVIDRPGNYQVTVDLYENGQYIGQDMRAFDVEQRTLGPMFIAFSSLLLVSVLFGVKQRWL